MNTFSFSACRIALSALALVAFAAVPKAWAQDESGAAISERDLKPFGAMVNLSILETWIPTKYGFTGSYAATPASMFEVEYLRGSLGLNYFGLDFGSITDQRLSAIWRYYGTQNTFNIFTGLNYSHLDVHLGSKLLETVTSSERANVEVMKIASMGLIAGIGNRWQTKSGVVLGIDWLVINIPVVNLEQSTPFLEATSNEETRKKVERVIRIFRKIPTFAVAKIQLGISF